MNPQPSGYLTVTPEKGEPYQLPWSCPQKRAALRGLSAELTNSSTAPCIYDKEPTPVVKVSRPLTQAEEIFEEVKEWYRVQGKPVPISDAKACLDMIKAEKKMPEPEPERPKTLEGELGPKPMWGDPLFWDYWRKAKALGFTKR